MIPRLFLPALALSIIAAQHVAAEVPGSPTSAPTSKLFNGWGLSPAGKQTRINDVPMKTILSPDRAALATVCSGLNPALVIFDVRQGRVTQTISLERSFNGIAFSKDGKRLFVTGGASDMLYCFVFQDGKATQERRVRLSAPASPSTHPAHPDPDFFAGMTVHPESGKLYLCNEALGEIWVANPESLVVEATIPVGLHPNSCVVGAIGRFLYVSHWGEQTVGIVDLEEKRLVARVRVGMRPNDMVLAPDGRLFVACAGDNSVHVIRTRALEQRKDVDESAPPAENAQEIISTSLYPSSPEGSTPCGLAVSPDGAALYIANADNNDVALVDIANPNASRVAGFVPTGWYPTTVACDGNTIFVANGKGLGSRPSYPSQNDRRGSRRVGETKFDSQNGALEGWISSIAQPDAQELVAYTRQVRNNSPYTPQTLHRTAQASDCVIPDRVGQECPIKHVLYIIKENRTYDQVFGDMKDAVGKPIGDGDPDITLFGEDVTPNQHQLARDYVLLDHLYCNGEVSADGHSWCDAAIATDFKQRSWILRYTQHGNLPGNLEMESPTAGFLWDLCRRQGVSFKCYGEGGWAVPNTSRGTWSAGRDMDRVSGWIKDLHDAENGGELPQFMIMSLGENHTRGTAPGAHTPKACVASNDIAVGKLVAAATRSKFWKEMAIFIIEDDAQNGPDHIDAHRTAGLVISPYIKPGQVDSTPYTTTSMVRTMELILGLPPMTQYDGGATPMFNCFGKEPRMLEHKVLQPKVDLYAVNPKDAPGAQASAAMDFDEYDEAPEDELNRILWLAVKGPDIPYPTPIHRVVFTR
jgi:YVTN family beta-propeller protein